jgi:iron complex outermembrane recepter protein
VRPAHADQHIPRWAHRRAAAAVAILCAAAAASVRAGAQPSRPCASTGAEVVTHDGTWPSPLDALVTLQARGVSLRDALDRLGASSGVPLAYSSDLLPLDRPVCVVAERQPLGLVLATLLAGTNVQAQVIAHKVVLAPTAGVHAAQPAKVSVLERVIVTGSAIAASRRKLAVGVEVIDGEELRLGAAGGLASALDAYVPGLWLWDQAPSSLVAQYGGVRGASSFSTSYPKMYIDGVEVANPLLVTQLDPDVVDRVEVIRGPQGSALYGSDAISGVINVITRHDGASSSGASVQVSSLAGASASQFGTSLVPTHDQRIALRGGTNVQSAGLALEFGQTGAVFPSAQSRQTTLVGDARKVTSSTTLSGSARLFDRSAGIGNNPLLPSPSAPPPDATSGSTSGSGGMSGPGGGRDGVRYSVPTLRDGDQHVRLYTVGGSATIATRGVWTHTLLAGIDGYRLDNVADATNPFDAGVDPSRRGAAGSADRTTLRASSVAQLGGVGAVPAATLTLSIEQSVLRQRFATLAVASASPGQRYPTVVDDVARASNHNTGMLAQASTAWRDALFLTGGLRLERNDAFSGNDRYPVLPLLGAAFVRTLGPIEMKLRSSYGKGIRPPSTTVRGTWGGPTSPMGTNPGLDPEVQTGIESGIELYAGNLFSLQATRFDQRATGLIQSVAVAVDTQLRSGTPERRLRFQPENVGEITNRGWEMQAALRRGALGVKGTFTTVDSRVRAVADGYLGDLRVGDRMLAVPARTASLSASWATAGWSTALTATRAIDWINYDRVALASAYMSADGAEQRAVTGWRLRNFWRSYDGDTHLRLSASRDVGRGLELLFVGDNLLGGQLGEPDNLTIRQGRTITGGLRASF